MDEIELKLESVEEVEGFVEMCIDALKLLHYLGAIDTTILVHALTTGEIRTLHNHILEKVMAIELGAIGGQSELLN